MEVIKDAFAKLLGKTHGTLCITWTPFTNCFTTILGTLETKECTYTYLHNAPRASARPAWKCCGVRLARRSACGSAELTVEPVVAAVESLDLRLDSLPVLLLPKPETGLRDPALLPLPSVSGEM